MEPPSSKRKCTKIDHNYSVQDTFNGFDNEDIEESRSRLKKFELAISPPQEAHSPCGFTEICEEEDFKPLTSLSQAFPPIPDLIQDVVVKKDEPELFCINPYKIHCGYDQEIRRKMTPKFLPSDAIFNRRDNYTQEDIRRNDHVQLEVDSAPYRGEVFFAIIHDNPGLVGTPIYDHDGKDKTPFEVWTTNESKSERAKIERIGEVYGAVVSVNNSRLVNFKFPVLSSDFRNFGEKKIGRQWKLLQLPLPLNKRYKESMLTISQDDMKYAHFIDIQVVAELRRTKDTKHPKRVTQFVYDVPKEKPQDDDLDELFKQAKAVMNPETLSLILENCIQTANNLIVQNELLNGTPDCY